ncbi:hypothetical protein FO519_006564 [Halicephalobus sp. NKZ332]|nr:hypothetical protein FO519_006564 [Halicephalobus sp. NKZ332]
MSDIRKFFSPTNSKKPPASPKKSALSSERADTGSPKKLQKRPQKLKVSPQAEVLDLDDDDSEQECPVPKSLKRDAKNQKRKSKNSRRVILESSEEEYFEESVVSKTELKKRSKKLVVNSDSEGESRSPKKKDAKTPSPIKRPPRKKARVVETSEDEPSPKKSKPKKEPSPEVMEKPKEPLKKIDPLSFFGASTTTVSKQKTSVKKTPKKTEIVEEVADEEFIVVEVKSGSRKSPRKPLGEITKTPSPKKSASTTPEKPKKKQKEQVNPKRQKKEEEVAHFPTFNTVCVKKEAPAPATVRRAELPWVDKYKPQDMKSLAGQSTDKSPAKKLLQWLREWARHNLGLNGLVKKPKPNPFAAQHDGTAFKAALLSGPPGIGKTSAAEICCKELGLKFVAMNASDARNKRLLSEKTAELMGSRQMDEFLVGEKPNNKSNQVTHVLIMDEVDGMSGNQDRGGVAEVIQLIKETKIPVICICNDRMHPKIRSLANHCFDLRFQRPRVEQIKARLMTIVAREKLKITSDVLNDLMEASNHDIRQCVYSLQLIAAGASGVIEKKDISVNIFEAARKILSNDTDLGMKQEMFFSDYSIMPLFVQENYPNVRGENMNAQSHLRSLRQAAKCISDADVLDKQIRSQGSWNLLPEYGLMSCAIPAMCLDGHMTDQIAFPSWLGKNSSSNKRLRMMRQLSAHAHLKVTGNCHAMVTDYVPLLREKMSNPLIKKDVEGVREVIDVKINLKAIGALENPSMSWEEFFDEIEDIPGVSELLPEKNNVIRGQTNAYAVGRKLAPGRYGAIFEVLRKSDGRQFVAKLEVCEQSFNGINMDYKVLKAAEKAKCKYFCQLIDRGKIEGHFKFVVMQKMEENLWKLRHQFVEHRFSAPTSLRLAFETLNAIEELHSLGFVHRDIKPSNFLVQKNGSETRVIIIDFGICRAFKSASGEIREPRENCTFRGTTRYASLKAHEGADQAPRDDLESWLYLIIELMTGQLPWAMYRKQEKDLVKEMKQNARTSEGVHQLLKFCPKTEFRRIMNYLDGLSFYSQPDYNYLRQLISLAMKNNEINPDEI